MSHFNCYKFKQKSTYTRIINKEYFCNKFIDFSIVNYPLGIIVCWSSFFNISSYLIQVTRVRLWNWKKKSNYNKWFPFHFRLISTLLREIAFPSFLFTVFDATISTFYRRPLSVRLTNRAGECHTLVTNSHSPLLFWHQAGNPFQRDLLINFFSSPAFYFFCNSQNV